MKKVTSIILVVLIVSLLTFQGFAVSDRASEQIRSYTIDITTKSDYIYLTVYVSGNGTMDKIGCETIDIYEKNGSRWDSYVDLDEDDDGMSSSNMYAYANTFEIPTTENVEYMVSVTIFAENDDGRDTRSKTEYVTGR